MKARILAASTFGLFVSACIVASAPEHGAPYTKTSASALSPSRQDTVRWSLARTPNRRFLMQLAFHEQRGRMMLFSGTDTVALSDIWESDGVRWIQTTGRFDKPSARTDYAIAYDSTRGRMVVFGGEGPQGAAVDDTWEFDGASWQRMTPAASPSPRAGASMAYDAVRKKMVLFSGGVPTSTTPPSSDTWEYDGSTWRQLQPATSPQARTAYGITWDANRSRVVMFGGGTTATQFNDTWEWDGANWTPGASGGPSARSNTPLAYDPVRKRVVLFGGIAGFSPRNDTWEYDGASWSQRASTTVPATRGGHGLAYDPRRNRVVMYGGLQGLFIPPGQPPTLDDVWEWDGTNWTTTGVGDAVIAQPSARWFPTMSYDSGRGVAIMFGGANASAYNSEHWEWAGTNWTRRFPSPRPIGRVQMGMAYDAARGNTVLFGGYYGGGLIGDTWLYDGTASTWTGLSLPPGQRPSPRSQPAMAYDAKKGRVVLMGGQTSTGRIADTWEWNGAFWEQEPGTPAALARYGHAMAYDTARNKLVLFGGIGATNSDVGDTWERGDGGWTKIDTIDAPLARSSHSMAYDSVRKRIVLYGGADTDTIFDDTWEFDGVTWAQRPTSSQPIGYQGGAMAFDQARGDIIFFGGANNVTNTFSAETWRLISRGRVCSSNADCATGSCTDGVCCESKSCGTCQTCDGNDPGLCTGVYNESDPDSCSGQSTCDRSGVCIGGLGSPAQTPAQCASGFVADGVCCDSACTGACVACSADLKESGTRSGVCDFAKSGADPRDSCATDAPTSCQHDGTCDGRGGCRLYVKGSTCGDTSCDNTRAFGDLCDGLGACGKNDVGVDCGAYVCEDTRGCRSACESDAQCAATHRCMSGVCVSRAGPTCDGDHIVNSPDGTFVDCGSYKCSGDRCKDRCANINDCVAPTLCGFEGKCVAPEAATGALVQKSGCNVQSAHRSPPACAPWLLAMLFVWRRRHQARPRHVP